MFLSCREPWTLRAVKRLLFWGLLDQALQRSQSSLVLLRISDGN